MKYILHLLVSCVLLGEIILAQGVKLDVTPLVETIVEDRVKIFPYINEEINETKLQFSYPFLGEANRKTGDEFFSLSKSIEHKGFHVKYGLTVFLWHETLKNGKIVFSGNFVVSTPTSDLWKKGVLELDDLKKYETNTPFQFTWNGEKPQTLEFPVKVFNYDGVISEKNVALKFTLK